MWKQRAFCIHRQLSYNLLQGQIEKHWTVEVPTYLLVLNRRLTQAHLSDYYLLWPALLWRQTKLWIASMVHGSPDLMSSAEMSFMPGALFMFWHLITVSTASNVIFPLCSTIAFVSCVWGVEEFLEIRRPPLTFAPDDCSVFVFIKGAFGLISTPQALHCFVGLSCVVAGDVVVNFFHIVVKSVSFLFFRLNILLIARRKFS